MNDLGVSTEMLAKEAGVTELHVDYMRSFARTFGQIEYLIDVLREVGRRDTSYYISETVTMTIPMDDRLVEELDEMADRKDVSRSQIIINLLEDEQ